MFAIPYKPVNIVDRVVLYFLSSNSHVLTDLSHVPTAPSSDRRCSINIRPVDDYLKALGFYSAGAFPGV